MFAYTIFQCTREIADNIKNFFYFIHFKFWQFWIITVHLVNSVQFLNHCDIFQIKKVKCLSLFNKYMYEKLCIINIKQQMHYSLYRKWLCTIIFQNKSIYMHYITLTFTYASYNNITHVLSFKLHRHLMLNPYLSVLWWSYPLTKEPTLWLLWWNTLL